MTKSSISNSNQETNTVNDESILITRAEGITPIILVPINESNIYPSLIPPPVYTYPVVNSDLLYPSSSSLSYSSYILPPFNSPLSLVPNVLMGSIQ